MNWKKEWCNVLESNFSKGYARWFQGGLLNVTENCVDRWSQITPDKVAIIWERDEIGNSQRITYFELKNHVNKFANMLKKIGVKKGDIVTLYMPMIPEVIYGMLGCARIGAVHNIVFAGFSAISLQSRILDSKSKYVSIK